MKYLGTNASRYNLLQLFNPWFWKSCCQKKEYYILSVSFKAVKSLFKIVGFNFQRGEGEKRRVEIAKISTKT
jgi:hypothetical protein